MGGESWLSRFLDQRQGAVDFGFCRLRVFRAHERGLPSLRGSIRSAIQRPGGFP
jgi:hypothetical protein